MATSGPGHPSNFELYTFIFFKKLFKGFSFQYETLRSGLSITPADAPCWRTFSSFPRFGMVLEGTKSKFQSGQKMCSDMSCVMCERFMFQNVSKFPVLDCFGLAI